MFINFVDTTVRVSNYYIVSFISMVILFQWLSYGYLISMVLFQWLSYFNGFIISMFYYFNLIQSYGYLISMVLFQWLSYFNGFIISMFYYFNLISMVILFQWLSYFNGFISMVFTLFQWFLFQCIQIQAFKHSFVHFENLNYASCEQYYSNEFSHNAIGYAFYHKISRYYRRLMCINISRYL